MSSVTVLIVEKLGNIKEQNIKYDEADLYKKAGHTTATGFQCHAQWSIEELDGKSYHVCVYGKTTGRANSENKYEFPPPIDSTLFFGNCIIVNKKGDKAVSITCDEWDAIYEHLFGGFEDLGDEDSEDEDETSEDDGLPRTKEGYVKDGFIVDDDEELDDAFEEEEEEESVVDDDSDAPKKKSKKSKKPAKKPVPEPKKKPAEKKTKKTKEEKPLANVFTAMTNQDDEDNYLDCTSELSEESYV